jgi:hypothetical protein
MTSDDWLAEHERHGPISEDDVRAGFSDAVLDAVNDAKNWATKHPPPPPFDPATTADLPAWSAVSAPQPGEDTAD